MLYRLEIANFYCIRQPQVIDLRVGENVTDAGGRVDALFPGSNERASRVAAFFGPNASGKSTVLKALAFIAWFTQYSVGGSPGATLPCERFNDTEAQNEPIRLAIEFTGPLDLTMTDTDAAAAQGAWRYDLSIDPSGSRHVVKTESLRQKPHGKGKWVRVFERAGDTIQISKAFGISSRADRLNAVRDNASLISTLAHLNHGPSLKLREMAKSVAGNIVVTRIEMPDHDVIEHYARNTKLVEALNSEVHRIDFGIEKMHIRPESAGPMAYFDHTGLHQQMPWRLQSHGTQTFIKNFPWLHQALEIGGVAVMDEIDISIHPLVLPEILRWFQDSARNPRGAQMWMTCHAASLLEELRKEEVFFCEKDSRGRASVYGLKDIQSVRRADNHHKKYLSGTYGAVPRIG